MSLKFANSANFHILGSTHRKIAIAAAAIAAVAALSSLAAGTLGDGAVRSLKQWQAAARKLGCGLLLPPSVAEQSLSEAVAGSVLVSICLLRWQKQRELL